MVRYIGKCAACKQVSARDYTDFRTARAGRHPFTREVRVYGRQIGAYFVDAQQDHACPRCNAPRWNARRVEGWTTGHACDARCTEARGFRCECSCGGKNHGKGWLVCEPAAAMGIRSEATGTEIIDLADHIRVAPGCRP